MLKNSAPKIRPKRKILHIAFFQKTDKIVYGGIGDSQGAFFRITNIRKARKKFFKKNSRKVFCAATSQAEIFMDKIALLNSIEKSIQFSFARSSGAGGQNVNKLNTKVHATLNPDALEGLSQTELALVKKRLAGKMNSSGEIFTTAQEERFQERNRAIALDKMKSIVVQAALVPKKRKKTKPTVSSIERRLNSKKLRGKIKELRTNILTRTKL